MRIACLTIVLVIAGCAPTLRPASISLREKPGASGETSSSSPQPSGLSPGVAAATADVDRIVALGREATAAAQGSCAPLLNHQPGWNEELAVGGMLAVELARSHGHLFLDGAVEKDPAKLSRDLAEGKPVTLPEGGKNALTAHLAIVGRNLARFSSRPDLPWVFGVIENDVPNAFNAPGGRVFVTTGLLKKVTNEAQLAGVLAHEIGHVVHKHSLEKYVEARHKQCVAARYALYVIEHGSSSSPAIDEVAKFARKFDGTLDLDAADSSFLHFLMNALLMVMQFGYDQEAELQTDKTALELVAFAGYDAAEYEKLLVALGDQGNGIASRHPKAAERVAKLKALREGELKDFVHGTAKPDLGKVFAPLGQ